MGCTPSKARKAVYNKPDRKAVHNFSDYSSAFPVPTRVQPPAPIPVEQGCVCVNVQTITGEFTQLGIHPHATVAGLKNVIEQRCMVPARNQRLVFAGRQLDDANSLSHYKITHGSIVHLAVRQGQGWMKPELQELLDMYEITLAQTEDLMVLARYDIVFLVDDSSSMNTVEVTAGVKQSRWKELRDTVSALVEFAAYFDDDGTDIYFLNRPGVEGVTDPNDERLTRSFASNPNGTTPLTRRFEEVVKGHKSNKPLLVMMATDGEPDTGSRHFVEMARKLLTMKRKEVRLGVIACTQNDASVEWLNDLDDDPKVGDKIDVCDDYEAEKKEVLATRRVSQFLVSDYYVKALLGPILAKYDNLDAAL